MPRRLQRSRRKGARLPSGTVVVTRPSKWGNPHSLELGRQEAVRRYRVDLVAGRLAVTVEHVRNELRGRDLACYCPLNEPCHADVLIEVANQYRLSGDQRHSWTSSNRRYPHACLGSQAAPTAGLRLRSADTVTTPCPVSWRTSDRSSSADTFSHIDG
jgi:hypothetical protein